MANQEIHEPTNYSQEIRKLQTTDPSHADVFNPLFERLINNDVFLKSLTERLIQEHTHSGADGEGSQIPLANIKMPVGEGEIVTDKELAHHINERNPHGTRAVDVGAASSQEFDSHSANSASTLKVGHVQLSSATTSTDETKAATPNAVKKVYDAVGELAGDGNTKTVKQLADDAAAHLAEKASLTKEGHVQLSSAVTSLDETKATTPKAVKTAYDLAKEAKEKAENSTTSIAFETPGVHIWRVPINVKMVNVTLIGASGGGGGGGGAGANIYGKGVEGANGLSGGVTSFGTYTSVSGGGGGSGGDPGIGGGGGSGTGTIGMGGKGGIAGENATTNITQENGISGSYGAKPAGASAVTTILSKSGQGGQGDTGTQFTGGGGGSGGTGAITIDLPIIVTPNEEIVITVGAGGSGGAGGVSKAGNTYGVKGGDGTGGIVVVKF